MNLHEFLGPARLAGFIAAACLLAGMPNGASALTTDLSATPPDLSPSVSPNIVLTFDNSGSMASQYIPDKSSDDSKLRFYSSSWNREFYNPAVTYLPAMKPDNTPMPDAPYTAAWIDGVCANRPAGGSTYCAIGTQAKYQGRKYSYTTGSGRTAVTRWLWDFNKYPAPGQATDPGTYDYRSYSAGVPVVDLSSDFGATFGTSSSGKYTPVNLTPPACTGSNAGTCGAAPIPGNKRFNNMGIAGAGIGGFYAVYNPATAGCAVTNPGNNCYTVVLMNSQTAAQKTNFANWYSYYRFRNVMARTGISRSFAKPALDANTRVVWQNIADDDNANTVLLNYSGTANTPATSTIDTFTTTVRTKFFNWLYANNATTNTPNRAALIRGAQFIGQSAGVQGSTNPFWDATYSQELTCRQNFQMLVTDGYWNEQNPSNTSTLNPVDASSITQDSVGITLPDGTDYAPAGAAQIYGNDSHAGTGCSDTDATSGSVACKPTIADIAFYYWAHDMRSDLANNVPPYFPDLTTGVLAGGALGTGSPTDAEVYFNPANDPASWQHVVQYIIGLGVPGSLQVPSSSPPNEGATGAALGDYLNLRRGTTAWPQIKNNDPTALDDSWHATVNGRGGYYNAGSPQELSDALDGVLGSISARQGSSTSLSATMSILTQGTQGFDAGFDTSNWSGFLHKNALDPVTGAPGAVLWDAGCILTGSGCTSGHNTVATGRAPSSRNILTSGNTSHLFDKNSLTAAQLLALRAVGETDDVNAKLRVDYLRGDRTNEGTAPLMRTRGSVLGAVISSQPVYVSGPTGGFSDNFPAGSDEANSLASNSYSAFLFANRSRAPTVYVGANDGMLHAFNAVDGSERWAYVPNTLFTNGKLLKLTDRGATGIVPGVDDKPVIQDAFFNGTWHTVLVNTMRLGGRGVFALDVTNPDSPSVLWEFANTTAGGAALGYTYSSANIGRLGTGTGKWVALVSSGYFQSATTDPSDPTSTDVNRDKTSLLVIDLQTGTLIRSIPTPTIAGVASFGLSAPAIYDANSDQVDDFAVAGDLAGNLWRFDLRSTTSSAWSADLMFKDYTTAPTAAAPAVQPISVMPVALRDTAAGVPVWVFGTGKYLGKNDRVATGSPSNIGPQAFYGIRDNGPGSATINVSDLFSQTLTQDAAGVRTLTTSPGPLANGGWMIPLGVKRSDGTFTEPGERVVVTVLPLYASNRAVLTSLIPKGNDPCDPGRRGSIMVINAGTGGAMPGEDPFGGTTTGGSGVVGKAFNSVLFSSISPPPLVGEQGGGSLLLPGLGFKFPDPPYYRGAWRELLDLL